MKRELMLLRHGKSDWSIDCDDFNRPLKDRGKRGAQKIGVWLQEQELQPDLIISSPAVRALTSAEKLVKAMGGQAGQIKQDKRLYAADVYQLKQIVNELPLEAERVLLVGHNPGFESFLLGLLDDTSVLPDDDKLMPTASLARMTLNMPWSEVTTGSANFISLMHAKLLPKGFPYRGAKGLERRKRPAYYYSQSSVIPYRFQKDKLQLLLVSSSKVNHWVVPKGIIEPGFSAQQSAAKEAFEEAGIEGVVEEKLLGRYHYKKWDAECQVQVFAMQVTKVIPEDEWEESHRHRQWVSVNEASHMIKQTELIKLFEQLEWQLLNQMNKC